MRASMVHRVCLASDADAVRAFRLDINGLKVWAVRAARAPRIVRFTTTASRLEHAA